MRFRAAEVWIDCFAGSLGDYFTGKGRNCLIGYSISILNRRTVSQSKCQWMHRHDSTHAAANMKSDRTGDYIHRISRTYRLIARMVLWTTMVEFTTKKVHKADGLHRQRARLVSAYLQSQSQASSRRFWWQQNGHSSQRFGLVFWDFATCLGLARRPNDLRLDLRLDLKDLRFDLGH